MSGRCVVTLILPRVLVVEIVTLGVLVSRLGVVPVVVRLWVGHGWAVILDHVARSVAVLPKVVIDHPAGGVVVVMIATAIALAGAGVAAVGERPGSFEVVARTVAAHLGETDPEMDTTDVESASEVPAVQLCRDRRGQQGQ
jgi:hypothetical protein